MLARAEAAFGDLDNGMTPGPRRECSGPGKNARFPSDERERQPEGYGPGKMGQQPTKS
jgi:hypothetical protein